MRSVVVALVVLLAPVLGGCLGPMGEPAPAIQLATQPPVVDARDLLDDLKWFCDTYPKRNVNGTDHRGARDWIATQFSQAGLDVYRDGFFRPNRFASPAGTPTGGPGNVYLENVVGVRWGLDREKWIVVGGHYDTVDASLCAAYDNGSGTMFTVKLAQAFANLTTNRTLMFIAFDGEEQGLFGSRHMIENLTQETWIHKGEVVAMVDFDMIGITHPHPSPLLAASQSPEMRENSRKWAAAIDFPEDKIYHERTKSGGRSDNAAFEAAEIPALLFMSNQDQAYYGPVPDPTPNVKYPFWHRADTYEMMVQAAGSEQILEQGVDNVLRIASGVILDLAQGLNVTFEPVE